MIYTVRCAEFGLARNCSVCHDEIYGKQGSCGKDCAMKMTSALEKPQLALKQCVPKGKYPQSTKKYNSKLTLL